MACPLPGLEPLLPPEIEREIFELSALSESRVIPRLNLVAHRVKIWIEPLLYRIISVEHPSDRNHTKHRIPEHICLRVLESWHDHTRHLSMGIRGGEHMDRILSMYTGNWDLALFHANLEFRYSKFLPLLAAMPLVRLSTNLDALFRPKRVDFNLSVFAHITHLNLLDISAGHAWDVGLGLPPCLTHISSAFRSVDIFPSPSAQLIS
ncbi:hypothetical protein C8R44DRAFT_895856 [Mycena epipterygia]|nr:hypothetical protein C8R44DRAFT_895856 [Mycena epipterygia]